MHTVPHFISFSAAAEKSEDLRDEVVEQTPKKISSPSGGASNAAASETPQSSVLLVIFAKNP